MWQLILLIACGFLLKYVLTSHSTKAIINESVRLFKNSMYKFSNYGWIEFKRKLKETFEWIFSKRD